MKGKTVACALIAVLSAAVILSNCTPARRYDFSLKNTLAIFLLNDEKDSYFCIPVQYEGDYQITSFEFTGGSILTGGYGILLERDEINIYVYLNDAADDYFSSDGEFNLIYSQEKGRVTVSKMNAQPETKNEGADANHYYIFIEKHLTDEDVKKITSEYEKGNVYSRFEIWYDLVIDGVEQNGSGLIDDFELTEGPVTDAIWFPPNLDFFKAKYMKG